MKQVVNLYPLDEKDEMIKKEFKIIEDLEGYVNKLLREEPILTAIKDCVVKVRAVKEGEIVDTRPRTKVNGKIYTFSETKRIVDKTKVDNIAVTNPDGEEYLLTKEKFCARYVQDRNNKWISKGQPQNFVVVRENIIITPTNWGGDTQAICKGGLINITDLNDIYGITFLVLLF